MIQETKLYKRGTMNFENFQCFDKVRNEKESGGLMTLIHKNLTPVLIPTKNQSKMSLNVLVVAATIRKTSQAEQGHTRVPSSPSSNWTQSI